VFNAKLCEEEKYIILLDSVTSMSGRMNNSGRYSDSRWTTCTKVPGSLYMEELKIGKNLRPTSLQKGLIEIFGLLNTGRAGSLSSLSDEPI
jgi:hypothetical protein